MHNTFNLEADGLQQQNIQFLLAKDRKLRLQLKWEQQNWTAKDWKNVAWIYESISTAKFRWIRIW